MFFRGNVFWSGKHAFLFISFPEKLFLLNKGSCNIITSSQLFCVAESKQHLSKKIKREHKSPDLPLDLLRSFILIEKWSGKVAFDFEISICSNQFSNNSPKVCPDMSQTCPGKVKTKKKTDQHFVLKPAQDDPKMIPKWSRNHPMIMICRAWDNKNHYLFPL